MSNQRFVLKSFKIINLKITNFLTLAGANFTVPDEDGRCPQALANEIGYTELAKYIDELG